MCSVLKAWHTMGKVSSCLHRFINVRTVIMVTTSMVNVSTNIASVSVSSCLRHCQHHLFITAITSPLLPSHSLPSSTRHHHHHQYHHHHYQHHPHSHHIITVAIITTFTTDTTITINTIIAFIGNNMITIITPSKPPCRLSHRH